MRIRIALIAATVVAFITSFMMLFSGFPAEATTGVQDTPHVAGHHATTVSRVFRHAVGLNTGPGSKTRSRPRPAGERFPTAVLSTQLRVHTAFSEAAIADVQPPPPPPPPTDATSTATTDWQCIRVRESGDRYNDAAEPSGAYGILEVTWLSNGYSGWPYEASPATQDGLALKLYNEFGWVPWSSRYACGL
jgi:hypothetical protein